MLRKGVSLKPRYILYQQIDKVRIWTFPFTFLRLSGAHPWGLKCLPRKLFDDKLNLSWKNAKDYGNISKANPSVSSFRRFVVSFVSQLGIISYKFPCSKKFYSLSILETF